MDPFYTKWMNDISGYLVDPNPDWAGNMVFLPWQMYWQYGDRRILEAHYADMAAYVDFLHAKAPDDIYTKGYGDWCRPNKGSWASFYSNVTDVDTSMYAAITRIVSQTAAVLGKTDDATRYGQLADEITRTYNEKRFNPTTAAYGDGSQTTAIMPLALGLVPQDERAVVFAHLVATINGKDKGHLDTGIFGTRYLLDVMSDFGEPDLAIRMLTRPDYPSFGYEIAEGATTVWEQWSFKGGMDSHNHVMFSGVSSSFYSRLAGITPLQPGYAQIGIRPVMPQSLSFVEASLKTVKGMVAIKWRREGDKITINATIPVITTARIAVPAAGPQAVTESGKPADQAEDVSFAGMEDGRAVFTVGSGAYRFASSQPHG
jgi:alpha-L-rhamnosidase